MFLHGQNIQSHTKSRQTTCTLFTPDHAEYKSNLNLKINNNVLPMATHPKVMRLTLDPKLTYSTHIHNISVQTHKPLQIIKTLTATGWGKQKEPLMAKVVMRPALVYASSIWSRPALINCKSCSKQHWRLPHDAHKTQTYNIYMTKYSHFPYDQYSLFVGAVSSEG